MAVPPHDSASTASSSTGQVAATPATGPTPTAAGARLAATTCRALVTGGGGFLGQAICRQLRVAGIEVHSLSRGRYPELDDCGVRSFAGDVADPSAVRIAAEGCDLVFHVAAKAGVYGRARDYWRANVEGTRAVLAVCRELRIGRLVHTSSPSVTFSGVDQNGVNEAEPYPRSFLAEYPRTKAIAEQDVLAANGPELRTTALRPHLIWGPGDRHLVPRLAARARQGRLRRIGTGDPLIDSCYIDNAATAHLLAAAALAPDHRPTSATSGPAGKAYFISNGEPWPLWTLINRLLAAVDAPPVGPRSISPRFAYAIGATLETLYRPWLMLWPGIEPPMTRFVARQLSTAHWFDLSAAERDFGYRPHVSLADGLERLRSAQRRDSAASEQEHL